MLRSVMALQRVDPGFDPERVLAGFVDLNWSKYQSNTQSSAFYSRLLDDLERQPDITAAAYSLSVPMGSGASPQLNVRLEGQTPDPDAPPLQGELRIVSPGFFDALGIPLLDGRRFAATDDSAAAPVAMVSQAAALRFWPGENPLGRRLSTNGGNTWATVVGVAGNVRHRGLDVPPGNEV
jgi:hypothetical protein